MSDIAQDVQAREVEIGGERYRLFPGGEVRFLCRADPLPELEGHWIAAGPFESAAVRRIAELEEERRRVRKALKWAVLYIADGANEEDGETPEHTCGFIADPESGRCEFHEEFFNAVQLAGLVIP